MNSPHISVCICTFRRPVLLGRLLRALEHQETGQRFTFSIVVADNDSGMSGRSVVGDFATHSRIETRYCAEPRQNIALTRNRAFHHSHGDYVAWIDDDEFPAPNWLQAMLTTCEATGAAGVLGPVRPYFDEQPPRWVIAGHFCERPEHATGTLMHWSKCRTGNVLIRRDILQGPPDPFRAEFGTGGEDVDFFRRMMERGHLFVWCNEGVTYEVVPPARWTRSYMLRRALLRGRNNLKLRGTRASALLKSAVAVPAYSIIIPATLFFGQHVFMKYSIKCCDHLGRILACVGLNPVNHRPI